MQQTRHFQHGDVVIHKARPDWGSGVVRQAQQTELANGTGQRLVVDFVHRGRVTIHTRFAPLVHATAAHAETTANEQSTGKDMTTQTTRNGQGWLETLERRQSGDRLMQLPEEMTDPFASLYRRLTATLDSFRYTREPRSLIEWAVAQTGMGDPLSAYTRSELEHAFPYYCGVRDQHLRELVRTAKRSGELETLNRVLRETTNPAAARALGQAMKA